MMCQRGSLGFSLLNEFFLKTCQKVTETITSNIEYSVFYVCVFLLQIRVELIFLCEELFLWKAAQET